MNPFRKPVSPVALFSTDSQTYLFDGSSGHIVQVPPSVSCERAPSRQVDAPMESALSLHYPQACSTPLGLWIEETRRDYGLFVPRESVSIDSGLSVADAERALSRRVNHLILGVTEGCNLRCSYCVFGDRYPQWPSHSTQSMSGDIGRRAVCYFADHSGEEESVILSFYGGEPTLEFELIKELVGYAKNLFQNRAVVFALTTNGVNLSKGIMRFLIENQFHVTVSLDGPEHIHDAQRVTRNGGGTFQKVIRTLQALRSLDKEWYDQHVRVACTVASPDSWLPALDFFRDCKFLPDSSAPVSVAWIRAGGLKGKVGDPESWKNWRRQRNSIERELLEVVAHLRDGDPSAHKRLGITGAFLGLKDMRLIHLRNAQVGLWANGTLSPPGCCLPGEQRLFVTVDGRLFPCERANSQCVDLCIGDVLTGIEPQRSVDIVRRFYDSNAEECLRCWALPICGLCPSVRTTTGSDWGVDKRLACRVNRATLLRQLSLYCRIREVYPEFFDDLYHWSDDDDTEVHDPPLECRQDGEDDQYA
ncbi:MAG: radical SAM protein [Kiritimatiellaeota bacterium]|nr:radical SAM protein [Kiritimatiellota bacterium]